MFVINPEIFAIPLPAFVMFILPSWLLIADAIFNADVPDFVILKPFFVEILPNISATPLFTVIEVSLLETIAFIALSNASTALLMTRPFFAVIFSLSAFPSFAFSIMPLRFNFPVEVISV